MITHETELQVGIAGGQLFSYWYSNPKAIAASKLLPEWVDEIVGHRHEKAIFWKARNLTEKRAFEAALLDKELIKLPEEG